MEKIKVKTKGEINKIIHKIYFDEKEYNIDLNHIDVSEITDMSNLFKGYFYLETLNIESWDTSNVENMESMFHSCKALKEVIGLSTIDTSNVTNMRTMFYHCVNFTGDLSRWNVSKVEDMSHMFESCYDFESDLSNWEIKNLKKLNSMFFDCYKFSSDLSKWTKNNTIFSKEITDKNYWLNGETEFQEKIDDLKNLGETIQPKTKDELIDVIIAEVEKQGPDVNLNHIDTSLITDMYNLFPFAASRNGYMNHSFVRKIRVDKWNVSNVTNMEGIFSYMHYLCNLDLDKWDTTKLENSDEMFESSGIKTNRELFQYKIV